MKSHSKTVLYITKDLDETFPLDLMLERCRFALFKLSYFKTNKIVLKYTTKNDKHIPIISITDLSEMKNNEEMLAQYLIDRIGLGISHKVSEIKSITLSYSYGK